MIDLADIERTRTTIFTKTMIMSLEEEEVAEEVSEETFNVEEGPDEDYFFPEPLIRVSNQDIDCFVKIFDDVTTPPNDGDDVDCDFVWRWLHQVKSKYGDNPGFPVYLMLESIAFKRTMEMKRLEFGEPLWLQIENVAPRLKKFDLALEIFMLKHNIAPFHEEYIIDEEDEEEDNDELCRAFQAKVPNDMVQYFVCSINSTDFMIVMDQVENNCPRMNCPKSE